MSGWVGRIKRRTDEKEEERLKRRSQGRSEGCGRLGEDSLRRINRLV